MSVLQGAAAVAGAGVIQTICLPLLGVYEGSLNGASQVFTINEINIFMSFSITQCCRHVHQQDIINQLYLCLWAEFLPEVPGLCLLARCLPPLHVFDGESAQDSTLQLHQRSPGLCWSSSRTHSTGTTDVLRAALLWENHADSTFVSSSWPIWSFTWNLWCRNCFSLFFITFQSYKWLKQLVVSVFLSV